MTDPTKPKRPFVDPVLRRKHSGLLDSLLASVGLPPDSILYRPLVWEGDRGLGEYNWDKRRMLINPHRGDQRRVLMHEFGHVLNQNDQGLFFDWLNPKGEDTPTASSADLERFANAFADMFQARGDTSQTRNKDAKLLYRILGRLNVQKQK